MPFCLSIELNLTYDGNGNLITGDGKYREYNEFNQLIRIWNGSSIGGKIFEEYIYHPTEDRILAKKVYNQSYISNDHLVETVIYVNENLVRTIKYPSANVINTSDKIYVKDENGIVAEFNPNQSKIFYHNDHLGSTSTLTNNFGSVIEQTFYEPFGGIVSGGNASRFYYEGKDYSDLIDEYDFNFRKYNPELKIFTKPDFGVKNIYDPQNLNRYSFERNNPYKYVDPDGKNPLSVLLAPALIGGGIAAGVSSVVYFYQVYNGERKFNGWELTTIAGTSFLAGAITTAVAEYTAGMGLIGAVTTGVTGFSTSSLSQLTINKVEGNPLGENVLEQGVIGGISAGIFYMGPSSGNYRIKYPSSYFTTKTGGKFAMYTFIPEVTQNYLSYSIDQSSSINSGSSSGTYVKEGQCYCGQQPRDSYNPDTGVYIDENGNGYSTRNPDSYSKKK